MAEGDLPAEADPRDLARYVVTVMHGMAVQAAGGASREELRRVAELALRAWPRAPEERKRGPSACWRGRGQSELDHAVSRRRPLAMSTAWTTARDSSGVMTRRFLAGGDALEEIVELLLEIAAAEAVTLGQ